MKISTFRLDIEGARAVAVLSVVAFHFGLPQFRAGFIGVDLFFVISGYLISDLLCSELQRTGHIDFAAFYGRRMRRLLPALFFVIFAATITGIVVMSPMEQKALAKSCMASFSYISNFWFLSQTTDYFAPESAINPLLHTWSLSVEEQFYIFWPGLLLLVWRFGGGQRGTTCSIAFVTTLSFVLCIWLTGWLQPAAFFSSPARSWEFGLGALAARAGVGTWIVGRRLSAGFAWVGVTLLVVSFMIVRDEVSFPGWIVAIPDIGMACLLLGGFGGMQPGPSRLLSTPLFVWIGKLSYSIYLWHWPVLVFTRIQYPMPSVWKYAADVGITAVCATFSYFVVERPIRNSKWLAAISFRSVGVGVSLTAGGIVLAIIAGLAASRFETAPTQQQISAVIHGRPPTDLDGRHCLLEFKASTPVTCTFGSDKGKAPFVLFGDSHADQWTTPMAEIAGKDGRQLITFLKSSCAVADVPVYNIRLHRISQECEEWRWKSIAAIKKIRPKFVVIGEFSANYVAGQITTLGDYAVSQERWKIGLERTLRSLSGDGIRIMVLQDSPTPFGNPAQCLARAVWRKIPEWTCDTPAARAVLPNLAAAERAVVAQNSGSQYISLSDAFCTAQTCSAKINGVIVFRDSNHVSEAFAASLETQLQAAFTQASRH